LRAASTPTATGSSGTSTSRSKTTCAPGTRLSAWTPRRRSWWDVQERRPGVVPGRRAGQGQHARLPRSGPGQGDPLRDL
jgi:hypothetical protein